MGMEAAERRAVVRAQQLGAPLPPVDQQDPLPCPRCTSINTKFCYYNNYNFSQPRHFCKSCRRYWTHGGTLRDIPVGGGSRKSAKRSRTTSASVSATTTTATSSSSYLVPKLEQPITTTAAAAEQQVPLLVSLPFSGGVGAAGGFTSLLSGGGFLGLGGFGLGLGLDDVGYGLESRGVWAFQQHDGGVNVNGGGSGGGRGGRPENGGDESESRNDTWQMENGEVVGFVDGADCFTTTSLTELAISTSDNGLITLK